VGRDMTKRPITSGPTGLSHELVSVYVQPRWISRSVPKTTATGTTILSIVGSSPENRPTLQRPTDRRIPSLPQGALGHLHAPTSRELSEER